VGENTVWQGPGRVSKEGEVRSRSVCLKLEWTRRLGGGRWEKEAVVPKPSLRTGSGTRWGKLVKGKKD